MNRNEFQSCLKSEGLIVSDQALLQFDHFHQMLLESNQKFNLISSSDEARIYERHFLDSIGLLKLIQIPHHAQMVDLGSGAGFPGIPLKIMRPDLTMNLVESRQKRAQFLAEVVERLGLETIRVFGQRMEDLGAELSGTQIVVSRAVSTLINLCKWSSSVFQKTGDRLIVFKGSDLDEELKRLEKKRQAYRIQQIEVMDFQPFPLSESVFERKLVVITF